MYHAGLKMPPQEEPDPSEWACARAIDLLGPHNPHRKNEPGVVVINLDQLTVGIMMIPSFVRSFVRTNRSKEQRAT